MDAARGIRANDVFGYQNIAGTGDGKIRFSGDDHSKFLHGTCDLHIAIAIAIGHDFAEVNRAPFGADGPQDIGEIFRPKIAGCLQVMEAGIDGQPSGVAGHLGTPVYFGHESSAFEVYLG